MHRHTAPIIAALALGSAALLLAGPLDPPAGPVAPTYKTLAEVEPRTAINSTNTPGDADSLYRITQPGSYYLPGNITGVAGKQGIQIEASSVTVDLGGFALTGVPGSLAGISVEGTRTGVAVTNGTVGGWGGEGVMLINPASGSGEQQRVERINSVGNAEEGIVVGDGSVVRNCQVRDCMGSQGIRARGTALVDSCVVIDNNGVGIDAGSGSTVTNCTVSGSSTSGIIVGDGATVTACTSRGNGAGGIIGGFGCTLSHCNTSLNDAMGVRIDFEGNITACSSVGNGTFGFQLGYRSLIVGSSAETNVADGIYAFGTCTIRANNCSSNGSGGDGAGIHTTGDDSVIEGNHCESNDRGIDIDGDGARVEANMCAGNGIGYAINGVDNFFSRNTARGNATNWAVVAGNVIFVVEAATAGIVVGDSGGVSPGSTNPNANYSH
ncbi:MAG: right-handed parallel beta-helix repeat-containing protein [Phycisphaerales bacterium]|nr:right-handed parallel beta-helix repeat-containing protein [Phycisphaerales bacterium]